ncbi:MAG: hypothetical protein NFW04_08015 [Candidatus Accumulibacter sp.]|uniref:LexA family protein n=1 Tax=Accumulibacter sp. TaxID=2053492 RepID=UPI0025F7FAC8|nr:hypothetical protein [Accumulibacter sp.]MCM8598587.1 hypothetical protein [Accumulibacter sp.]MCM8661773.1 hypothetical protein [Accumulibacter sp.]
MKLAPGQQEVLDFMWNTVEMLGAPPTRRQIAGAFGLASPKAAEDHLKALAGKVRHGVSGLEQGQIGLRQGTRCLMILGLAVAFRVAA